MEYNSFDKGFVLADDEKNKFIQGVLNVYGDYSADELEKMMHIPLERNSQSATAERLSAPNGKFVVS